MWKVVISQWLDKCESLRFPKAFRLLFHSAGLSTLQLSILAQIYFCKQDPAAVCLGLVRDDNDEDFQHNCNLLFASEASQSQ